MITQIVGYTLILILGGVLYCGIEIAYRGFTHISMFFTGGFCLLLVGSVEHLLGKNASFVSQMVICGAMITAVEFLVGMVVNRFLNLNVWDYSREQYNIQGQICLLNANLWFLLSGPMIILFDFMRNVLLGIAMPHYKLF